MDSSLPAILAALGLDDKSQKVYLELLERRQASVRTIAEATGVGRGTVYNILKALRARQLVSIAKKGELQYFAAEDPAKLLASFEAEETALREAKEHFSSILPELQNLYNGPNARPKVTYFTGLAGIKSVLEDMLFTMAREEIRTIRAYSSEELRGVIYEAYPQFTQRRIDAGIQAKVIKMGGSGVLRGLDEARLLPVDKPLRTYIHIYGDKVSYITSKSSGYIMAALIEDMHIARTQEFLFEALWETLPLPQELPRVEEDF